jgi:hypothetical protein
MSKSDHDPKLQLLPCLRCPFASRAMNLCSETYAAAAATVMQTLKQFRTCAQLLGWL